MNSTTQNLNDSLIEGVRVYRVESDRTEKLMTVGPLRMERSTNGSKVTGLSVNGKTCNIILVPHMQPVSTANSLVFLFPSDPSSTDRTLLMHRLELPRLTPRDQIWSFERELVRATSYVPSPEGRVLKVPPNPLEDSDDESNDMGEPVGWYSGRIHPSAKFNVIQLGN